jgi:hypothetical protein
MLAAVPRAHALPWCDFWRSVSQAALLSPLRRTPLDVLLGRWTLDHSPAFIAMDLASRLFSPYDLNPRGANPLRRILAETIDFDRLARADRGLAAGARFVVARGGGHEGGASGEAAMVAEAAIDWNADPESIGERVEKMIASDSRFVRTWNTSARISVIGPSAPMTWPSPPRRCGTTTGTTRRITTC